MAELLSTRGLADRLGRKNLRILDLRGNFAVYEEGHIRGAQFLHIETPRLSDGGVPCKMMPLELLCGIFRQLGITEETPAVILATRPADQYSATCAAWSLAVTDNQHAHNLDGGLRKWQADGSPLTREYPTIPRATYRPRFDETIFADWRYLYERLDDPGVALVDTRGAAIYTGESGPTARLGHISGAIV